MARSQSPANASVAAAIDQSPPKTSTALSDRRAERLRDVEQILLAVAEDLLGVGFRGDHDVGGTREPPPGGIDLADGESVVVEQGAQVGVGQPLAPVRVRSHDPTTRCPGTHLLTRRQRARQRTHRGEASRRTARGRRARAPCRRGYRAAVDQHVGARRYALGERSTAGITPMRPAWKSSIAWRISSRVFITNGP